MQRKVKLPGSKASGSYRLFEEISKYLHTDENTSVTISSDPGSFARIMNAFSTYEREVKYLLLLYVRIVIIISATELQPGLSIALFINRVYE